MHDLCAFTHCQGYEFYSILLKLSPLFSPLNRANGPSNPDPFMGNSDTLGFMTTRSYAAESPEEAATIEAGLRGDWPEARIFLERLVRANSHTLNLEGVEANAGMLARGFAPLGFHARRIPSTNSEYAPHLVLDNHAEAPAVLLVSHLDTVFTPEEQMEGFSGLETPEGFLRGPGTNDIKGGSVMMWLMLRAWMKSMRATPPVRWILAWNSCEEHLSPDFSASLLKELPDRTLACLVMEADNRKLEGHEVVVARKGRASWRVVAHGRGAHSGNAHAQGLNAIERLSEIVLELQNLTDYGMDLTVNVGTISGGVSTNRVPDRAVAEFEVRFRSHRGYEDIRQHLLGMNATGSKTRCGVVLEPLQEIAAWSGEGDSTRLAETWREAGRICGYEVGAASRGGLSDANYFSSHLPTLDGLGPRGGNAHGVGVVDGKLLITEYVDPDSFFTKALVNLYAIRRLLCGLNPMQPFKKNRLE